MESSRAAVLLAAGMRLAAGADVVVKTGVDAWGDGFRFAGLALPACNDAATGARFALLDGAADPAGAGTEALHDGRVPSAEDQPAGNFFFRAGSVGGRLFVDLGRPLRVREVNTYSWHPGARGPQVYTLYGADGLVRGFDAAPQRGSDLASCGWLRLARVDTRAAGGGGQHGVSVRNSAGALGRFRYLLFDVEPTEGQDAFGNTFYSEIDVVEADGPAPVSDPSLAARPERVTFEAAGGSYRFAVDVAEAPDLREWSGRELRRLVGEWYPRLALLLGEGHAARAELLFRFRVDMGGTPASASGGCVNLNAVWFRRELGREAPGAVVHEMVHVVQDYGRAGSAEPRPQPVPGWVVEGIADYVRWFLFEPQSRGAEITKENVSRATYDGSYRITANFLAWATRRYDRDLVRKLNTAVREGRYSDALWQGWTGKSVQALGEAWLAEQRERLSGGR